MSVFMGEYLGFTLGGIHSSQLNIVRVSNGNRYTKNLTPNFQDKTVVIDGANQTYFFGMNHTQLPITIDFAFDDLREEDIRKLQQLFYFNGVKELIYDETPYKKYYVKCSQPPVIKFIPFSDTGDVLNYKGEGTINLVAYFPYGVSTQESIFDIYSNYLRIFNLGDIKIPFQVYYPVSNTPVDIILESYSDTSNQPSQIYGSMTLSMVEKLNTNDTQICINSKTHLIEGIDANGIKTGTLYDKFITSGDYFLLPLEDSYLYSSLQWNKVKYNYLYYCY